MIIKQSAFRRRLTALLLTVCLLVPMMLPARAAGDPGEKIVYGYSGSGRELVAWRYGKGPNVMVLGFCIHGWEDVWNRDGEALVWTAEKVRASLSNSNLAQQRGWSVYVLPCMNPDGLYSGWTCNGPGRCTTSRLVNGSLVYDHGIDMNRCFPSGFVPRYNSRNYTGPTSLGCKEAVALASFIRQVKGSKTNILFDFHGWYQQTIVYSGYYGLLNQTVSKYFPRNTYTAGGGSGYLISYAHNLGYDSCLLELPNNIYSMEAYQRSGCADKVVSIVNDLIRTKPVACPNGHQFTESRKEPNCVESGLLVRTCTSCGYEEKTELPPNGIHDYDVIRVEPTCVTEGSEDCTCKICGFHEIRAVPPTGIHSYEILVEANPSCEYYTNELGRCTVCGLEKALVIEPLGHLRQPESETIVKAPTATRDGISSGPCGRCGKEVEFAVPRIFSDTQESWYSDALDEFYAAGYVNGTGQNQFSPNATLNRAALITMLHRAMGCPAPKAAAPFKDVQRGSWYADAVAWGYENGIIAGVRADEFAPKNAATREQTATILFRVGTYLGMDMTAGNRAEFYADWNQVRIYARNAMNWCVSNGILQGMTATELRPGSVATRAQAVCLCSRLLRLRTEP